MTRASGCCCTCGKDGKKYACVIRRLAGVIDDSKHRHLNILNMEERDENASYGAMVKTRPSDVMLDMDEKYMIERLQCRTTAVTTIIRTAPAILRIFHTEYQQTG